MEIDEALSNKVTEFSVLMREYLNNIKQLAHSESDRKEDIKNITEKAIEVLKKFEEETTGEQLLPTPESPQS